MREKLREGAGVFLSIEVASKLGMSEAVFLSQLHYWLQHSKNERDGFIFVYKTYTEWQEELHCLSNSTIRKAIKSLEKRGIVISTDSYNKHRVDRTKWYRIDYEKLDTVLDGKEENGEESDEFKSAINKQSTFENEQVRVAENKQTVFENEQSTFENKQVGIDENEQVNTIILNNTALAHEQNNTANKSSSSKSFNNPGVFNTPDEKHDDEPISVGDIYNAAQLIFEVNDSVKSQLSIAIRICGTRAVNTAIQQLAQQDHENNLKVDDVLALAQQIKTAS